MTLRVGLGLDVHPFTAGRPLVLGGVRVPHAQGLAGHSDADVLAHAIGDALLGASAAGDLGTHFPSSDPAWAGASSLVMLERIADLLARDGWSVVNIDAVIVAQGPRLAPHIAAMRERLAACLRIDAGRIGVKATTTDRLGSIGRGEGIAAEAVALIEQAPAGPSRA
jgi:2-C-methyl-D-erythritol 2,4-cyclodiphosphate synthase